MIGCLFLFVSAAGFALSALLHLATFTPAASRLGEGVVLALFALAFAPLSAMLARLRRAAPTRQWRRLRVYDWRAVAALVPGGPRVLVAATGLYVVMNLGLSLLLVAGESVSAEEHRAVTLRLLSGHLLLFYLLPLVYFRFVDPRRGALGAAASAPTHPIQGGTAP
jgi:hypothetical protein